MLSLTRIPIRFLRLIPARSFTSIANGASYYEILKLKPTATKTEIRNRFFEMAKVYHPDVSDQPGASEKFKEISEAYAILSIDNLRKEYNEKINVNLDSTSKSQFYKASEDQFSREDSENVKGENY